MVETGNQPMNQSSQFDFQMRKDTKDWQLAVEPTKDFLSQKREKHQFSMRNIKHLKK